MGNFGIEGINCPGVFHPFDYTRAEKSLHTVIEEITS